MDQIMERTMLIQSTHGFILVCCMLLCGCQVNPPKPVLTLSDNRPMAETSKFLDAQARKCWGRSSNWLRDSIEIDSRMSIQGSAVISAARWSNSTGKQRSFLVIEITVVQPGSSSVMVSEGDYGCDLPGSCSEMGLAADVKRWLSGDQTCSTSK